uniref:Uncharacterized protein n=1 Tax=viral metagenome TaxID=1070528 RepID=A0A6C0EAV4_9ZZZZ
MEKEFLDFDDVKNNKYPIYILSRELDGLSKTTYVRCYTNSKLVHFIPESLKFKLCDYVCLNPKYNNGNNDEIKRATDVVGFRISNFYLDQISKEN